MHQVRNVATVIGVALLGSLLLFPPFAVIDLAAAQPRHAALGHYPRWRPPIPVMAEHVLTGWFGFERLTGAAYADRWADIRPR